MLQTDQQTNQPTNLDLGPEGLILPRSLSRTCWAGPVLLWLPVCSLEMRPWSGRAAKHFPAAEPFV